MVRMRATKGKRNNRRSHHGASVPTTTMRDGVVARRHHASRVTGRYRSRTVLSTERRDARLQKKRQNQASETPGGDEKRVVEQATVKS